MLPPPCEEFTTSDPLRSATRVKPPEKRDMKAIEAGVENSAKQFQVLEQGLEGKDYVAGKTFTMGDIIIGVNLYRWRALPITRPTLPRIEAYYARLAARPAFQKHILHPLT